MTADQWGFLISGGVIGFQIGVLVMVWVFFSREFKDKE